MDAATQSTLVLYFLSYLASVSIILLVLFLFLIPSLANWVGRGVTTLYTDPFYPHLHQTHTDNFWSTFRCIFGVENLGLSCSQITNPLILKHW